MSLLCAEFGKHDHHERPHQGLGNELIQRPNQNKRGKYKAEVETIRLNEIRCQERLGGLLKSYSRNAA